MLKLALVVTVWVAGSGGPEYHLLDHSLSGEDCLAYLADPWSVPGIDDLVLSLPEGSGWTLACERE